MDSLARDRPCEMFTVLKSKAFGSGEDFFSESVVKFIGCNLFSHGADVQALIVIFLQ